MNDLPNLVHEATLETIKRVRFEERARIKAAIMDRVTDLKTCGDDDDCQLFGEFIESYIPEWLGEEA
jgi:hypothetical protein